MLADSICFLKGLLFVQQPKADLVREVGHAKGAALQALNLRFVLLIRERGT